MSFVNCTAPCVVILCLFGCAPRETVTIQGMVTLDDKPLPEGSIKFFYGDQLPAGVGKVRDGKYQLECKPRGLLRVEITAVKDLGPADPNNEKNVPRVQYLPEQYNFNSQLTAEVTKDSAQVFNFALQSPPAAK